MAALVIFDESGREALIGTTQDPARIAAVLATIGAGFERREAATTLPEGADATFVLDAYVATVAQWQQQGGYQSLDVARLLPDSPDRDAQLAKFIADHPDDGDEIRFFVEGGGTFFQPAGGQVIERRAERGNLIRAPAGARHWFDTGAPPFFTALRTFTRPDGWVENCSGDQLAARFVAALA